MWIASFVFRVLSLENKSQSHWQFCIFRDGCKSLCTVSHVFLKTFPSFLKNEFNSSHLESWNLWLCQKWAMRLPRFAYESGCSFDLSYWKAALPGRGWQTCSIKGQIVNISVFARCGLCCNYSVLLLQHQSVHRQYLNISAWLCSP